MTRGLHPATRIAILATGFLLLLVFSALTACGGGGGGGGHQPPPVTLRTIAVTPATPTISLGGTQQFTATGSYSDSSTRDLTATATWSSSSTAVATISPAGLATSVAAGSTTISATSGGITGSTSLNVTAATLSSLAVTPANPSLGYVGAVQQFRATGTYSDQSTRDLTLAVTWTSSSPGVATIGADGFARTVAASGTTTIRAAQGSVNASTVLTLQTATVSGQVVFPDSDMGWKPSVGDFQARGGGRVRVLGTGIVADVVQTSASSGTFSLSGVPWGTATLVFEEGDFYDVFTQASKRLAVNVTSATVSGVSFSFVYHWDELAGYPPAWNTMNSQGPVGWKAQFVSDQVAFVAFRRDIPNERVELYRTTDRGATWTMVGQWVFDQALWNTQTWLYPIWTDFYFLDASHGVMHATTAGIPCDTGGAYFVTTDGGLHWGTAPLPMTPTGYHVDTYAYSRIGSAHIVVAARVGCGVQGYSSGFYDAIWESVDAGVNWTLAWHSARDEAGGFIGLDASSAGKAVAYRGGSLQQFVLRDALGSWTTHPNTFGIFSDSRDLSMVGDSAWMISVGGTAPNGTYRSVDAGEGWTQVSGGLPQDFDFATTQKAFAQAGGPAYVTYDGGVTWRYQTPGGAIWPGVMDVWAFDRTHAAWAEVGFGDPNGIGQLFTYVEPVLASVEAQPATIPGDATYARGSTRIPMLSMLMTSRGPAPVTLGAILLHASGSANDATAIAGVQLWNDRNADGAVDAGDALLASGTYGTDDGTATLTIAGGAVLEQLVPLHLLVTCDLAGATGYSGTLRMLAGAGDFSVRDTGSNVVVAVTAPTAFALASRTVTVNP